MFQFIDRDHNWGFAWIHMFGCYVLCPIFRRFIGRTSNAHFGRKPNELLIQIYVPEILRLRQSVVLFVTNYVNLNVFPSWQRRLYSTKDT